MFSWATHGHTVLPLAANDTIPPTNHRSTFTVLVLLQVSELRGTTVPFTAMQSAVSKNMVNSLAVRTSPAQCFMGCKDVDSIAAHRWGVS